MKHIKTYILTFSIILLALVFANPTHADAAPPAVPDGENILPGEEFTMVQMVAEEVIIDVSSTLKTMYNQWYDDYNEEGFLTAYNCTFWMVNQGEETENLAVRFPISSYENDSYLNGKIEIESIKINGKAVPWTEDERESPFDYSWAHFDVTFPPGEEVEIKVTYTTITLGWSGSAHQSVSYVLETGAGWYGPIGQGRIILRMPYKVTPENVMMTEDRDTPLGEMTDYDMVWEFTDLEPTSEDNWKIKIVAPDLWLEILADREKLEESPNNLSALYRLADNIYHAATYKSIDIYIPTLYKEGMEAIEKAISLNPDEVTYQELYESYLELSGRYEYITMQETQAVELAQIQTATAMSPATETATPTPPPSTTPTPAPSSTHTATATSTLPPTPTKTPAPEITPTPTIIEIEDAPRSPLPTTFLVIAAIILAAGLAVFGIKSRK